MKDAGTINIIVYGIALIFSLIVVGFVANLARKYYKKARMMRNVWGKH